MPVDKDIHSMLKSVTIFSGVDDENLDKIFSQCDVIERKVGDVLIEEDTEATQIFIILKGSVKVVLNLKNKPLDLVELGPGHCVGEASIIGIQKHCASVVIVKNAQVLAFPRHVLMDIYNNDKELFSLLILNIARELARRLYRTDQELIKIKGQRA